MQHLVEIVFHGLIIGVLISAPMGPIGILVLQRTLNKGRRPGLYTGLGASISDLFYCLLAGFGLSFVTDFIEQKQNMLQIAGSLMLLAYGIYLFMHNPSRRLATKLVREDNYWKDFVTGFLFTVANPLILFFIIGLMARFTFTAPYFRWWHYLAGYLAIAGGALLWWLGVTRLVDKARGKFNVRSMWIVNRIIASLLLLMALVGMITGINAVF